VSPKVIFAVLNWGLGHATRSVPVIEALLRRNAEVEIASSGPAKAYLERRFPLLKVHELPDRTIRYHRSGAKVSILFRSFYQPRINRRQRAVLNRLCRDSGATHIVSDNVYGAAIPCLKSAIITHQLALPVPWGAAVVNHVLAGWLNEFTEVWIPDAKNRPISGSLSTNDAVTSRIRHIGILSRFSTPSERKTKRYRYAAVLGGPEPQRTVLEEKVLKVFAAMEGEKILFRGSQKDRILPGSRPEVVNFGDGHEMSQALEESEVVLARSGFSSIADLIALGCRGILIPTPGQSEQTFLAKRMAERGWFETCSQKELDVERIERARFQDQRHLPSIEEAELEAAVKAFIEDI
jgi:UDP:flavonoid glycosyltransferase YjiC (YdhE family)